MSQLTPFDKRFVVERLPRDVRDVLSSHPGKLYVGGGFIRAVVGNEEVNDIDIFGADLAIVDAAAKTLHAQRPGSRLHKTGNALTLLTPNRMPVQFITRWLHKDPAALMASFDFSVCAVAVWRGNTGNNPPWESACGDRFYIDLAGKRLFYTSPKREEEAGGSLLRVIKYVRRGYTIQVDSLGRVVERLSSAVHDSRFAGMNPGAVYAALLREVDPLHIIDGLEVIDDHASAEADTV